MVSRKSGRSKRIVKIGKVKRVTYADYLDGKIKLKTYQKVGVLLLIVVLAGFFGWLWEFTL